MLCVCIKKRKQRKVQGLEKKVDRLEVNVKSQTSIWAESSLQANTPFQGRAEEELMETVRFLNPKGGRRGVGPLQDCGNWIVWGSSNQSDLVRLWSVYLNTTLRLLFLFDGN